MIVYSVIKVVLFSLYKLLFGFKAYGTSNVPFEDKRGIILAPNHTSYLDPPLLGISLKKPVTYLAKDYLFKAFFVGWILRSVDALPIKSGSGEDFRSIRQLIKVLKDGKCVVVFPEGTRSVTGELKEPEPGVGFLALASKAWVVPVYIEGTYKAYPKGAKSLKAHPVRVYYGKPFIPAEDAGIAGEANPHMAVAQKIMQEIRLLKEAADKSK